MIKKIITFNQNKYLFPYNNLCYKNNNKNKNKSNRIIYYNPLNQPFLPFNKNISSKAIIN